MASTPTRSWSTSRTRTLFVDTVARIASGFGGINLEDIAAPRCFEIEGKLRQRLDIPVFHDDQHGTAIVVLAALTNAARVVGRDLASLRVVVQGIGSAGVAIINLLRAAGIEDIVPVDVDGIVEPKRKGTDPIRRRLARQVNPRELTGRQGRRARRRRRVHRRVRAEHAAARAGRRRCRRTASCSRWPTRRPRSTPTSRVVTCG